MQTYRVGLWGFPVHILVLMYPGHRYFFLRLGLWSWRCLLGLGFLRRRLFRNRRGLLRRLPRLDLLRRVVLLTDVAVRMLLRSRVEQQGSRRNGDGEGRYGPVGMPSAINQSIERNKSN